MDHAEEQTQEIEALQSIFFEEFVEISRDPPVSFKLLVKSDEPLPPPLPDDFDHDLIAAAADFNEEDDDDDAEDGDDDDDAEDGDGDGDAAGGDGAPTLTLEPDIPHFYLHVSFTPTYPETAPVFQVVSASPHLLAEDRAALLEAADALASEQLGMAMVFGVHAGIREKLEEIVKARIERRETEREKRRVEEEERERMRHAGTKVTKESFLEWRERFLKDMDGNITVPQAGAMAAPASAAAGSIRPGRTGGGIIPSARLTGRQLFEKDRSLAKSDMALLTDEDVTVEFDKELFAQEMEGLEDSDEEENAVLAGFAEDDD
ncbi:RWD domain-containing protein [Zopfochytrium polystomum]|nr:RWD domain-containing protein [Zopfochytrium polystomum]